MGFFESFSAPFMMSVALWPLVSFIVTVPVLAMLYHRDNRLGFGAALYDEPITARAVGGAARVAAGLLIAQAPRREPARGLVTR